MAHLWTVLSGETRKLKGIFTHPIFVYLTILGNSILLLVSWIVFLIEKDTNPDFDHYLNGLWWGVSTITTVGYGDVVPMTTWGRILGLFLMYTGTILFITFTGFIATFWVKIQMKEDLKPIEDEVLREEKKQGDMEKKIDQILEELAKLRNKI